MVDRLRHGECDLALCWPHDMVDTEDITVHNIAEFKAYLICSKENPLAAYKSVPTSKLADTRISMVDLSVMPATQRAMFKDWKRMGLIPPTTPTFDQVNCMEELLFAVSMDDNVVSLVPEFVRNNSTGNLAFLDLDMPNPPRFNMGVGYLSNNPNPALRTALGVLLDNRIPMEY